MCVLQCQALLQWAKQTKAAHCVGKCTVMGTELLCPPSPLAFVRCVFVKRDFS